MGAATQERKLNSSGGGAVVTVVDDHPAPTARAVAELATVDLVEAPSAQDDEARRMPGGRMPTNTVRDAVQSALVKKYGKTSAANIVYKYSGRTIQDAPAGWTPSAKVIRDRYGPKPLGQ